MAKAEIYDVLKLHIADDKNLIGQIYFSGAFDRALDIAKAIKEGKYIIVAPRICKAPNDKNKAKAEINQAACKLSMEGDVIFIHTDLDELETYESTDPHQGSGKWVGLLVNVGAADILGTKFDDYQLTQADADEAASVGGIAGEFVLWLKAEKLAEKPYEFTLTRDDLSVNVAIKLAK